MSEVQDRTTARLNFPSWSPFSRKESENSSRLEFQLAKGSISDPRVLRTIKRDGRDQVGTVLEIGWIDTVACQGVVKHEGYSIYARNTRKFVRTRSR